MLLIPCCDESKTIEKAVDDSRDLSFDPVRFQYDGRRMNQTDGAARRAAAIVHSGHRLNKGNIVRPLYCDIENDIIRMTKRLKNNALHEARNWSTAL